MATSGSVDFNLTRNEIITQALRTINIIGDGEDATADQISDGAFRLNMMIKAWRNKGISLPLYQDIVVFPEVGEAKYLIGATGDKATKLSDYVKTELSVAGVATNGTITVDSTTGMANGDVVGIELDDKTIQWTTINGAPSATVITLTTALTGAAAIDNHVYTYTSIAQRPIKVLGARVRREDGTEVDIEVINRDDYNRLSNKTGQGNISQVYYDPQLTNGVLYVWQTPANVADILILNTQRYVEDFDSVSDNADFPQEWLEAIVYNLAVRMSPKYGVDQATFTMVGAMADSFLQDAEDFDQEGSIQFVPY